MNTESIKLEVNVTAWSEAPPSELFSTVIIDRNRKIEEFIIDENDDSVTSLGSYIDSSSPPDPLIYLKLANFKPNHVFQVVHCLLHDTVLAELISDQIVVKAQQLRSQSLDLAEEPLFMTVIVKLTQKRYMVVPYSDNSATDLDQESEEETETTCAICLEEMLKGSQDNMQIPNCSHWFHENCFLEWLNRSNSCPLCRQPVYEEPE